MLNQGAPSIRGFGNEQWHAMFQLQKQLEHLNISHIESLLLGESLPLPGEDEILKISNAGECAGKSPEGNSKPCAHFGHQHTHHERLCVTTCGVILRCATFFGSKAVSVLLYVRLYFLSGHFLDLFAALPPKMLPNATIHPWC
jgi:hypothetical protein